MNFPGPSHASDEEINSILKEMTTLPNLLSPMSDDDEANNPILPITAKDDEVFKRPFTPSPNKHHSNPSKKQPTNLIRKHGKSRSARRSKTKSQPIIDTQTKISQPSDTAQTPSIKISIPLTRLKNPIKFNKQISQNSNSSTSQVIPKTPPTFPPIVRNEPVTTEFIDIDLEYNKLFSQCCRLPLPQLAELTLFAKNELMIIKIKQDLEEGVMDDAN